MERCNAGLSFWIVRSRVHKYADPLHAFRPAARAPQAARRPLNPQFLL
jgi:hypothetical protein